MTLVTTPTYTTFAEFTAHCRSAAVKAALSTEDLWKPYALTAEIYIDSYVGAIERYDDDQQRKFPMENIDGESEIPDDVKIAHIEITADLYLKGDQEKFEGAQGSVSGESWNASGYSKNRAALEGNPETIQLMIPPLAKRLLRRFKKIIVTY